MIVDSLVPRRLNDTSDSFEYLIVPFIEPYDALSSALFTSFSNVFLKTCITTSYTDTLGVRTRNAIPLRLNLSNGTTTRLPVDICVCRAV